ncbi:MAG: hypothetical protein ACI9JM_001122 [Halioglobus sp.]
MQGQLYTLEFWSGIGTWSFCGSAANPYAGGDAFDATLPARWDLGFSIEITH